MNFYEHKLNIRVLLDDTEEKTLRRLTEEEASEFHIEITENQKLQKIIEEAITEKLKA